MSEMVLFLQVVGERVARGVDRVTQPANILLAIALVVGAILGAGLLAFAQTF